MDQADRNSDSDRLMSMQRFGAGKRCETNTFVPGKAIKYFNYELELPLQCGVWVCVSVCYEYIRGAIKKEEFSTKRRTTGSFRMQRSFLANLCEFALYIHNRHTLTHYLGHYLWAYLSFLWKEIDHVWLCVCAGPQNGCEFWSRKWQQKQAKNKYLVDWFLWAFNWTIGLGIRFTSFCVIYGGFDDDELIFTSAVIRLVVIYDADLFFFRSIARDI